MYTIRNSFTKIALLFTQPDYIALTAQSLQFSGQLYVLFDFLSLLNHCNVWVMLSVIVLYCQMCKKKNNTISHKQRFKKLYKQWLCILSSITLYQRLSQKDFTDHDKKV